MAKKLKQVPVDTTLCLTKEQWLAVKAAVEFVLEQDQSEAPFCDFHLQQVLEMMGGNEVLQYNIEEYKECKEWYEKVHPDIDTCMRNQGGCGKLFHKNDLSYDADENGFCKKCKRKKRK